MDFFANRIYTDENCEYRLRKNDIKVTKILHSLDHKISKTEIRKKLGVDNSDIAACKIWAMMVMPDRKEYQKNKKKRGRRYKREKQGKSSPPIKFLFDENLSWKIIPEIVNNISHVTQIHLEDMAGASDFEIWKQFQTNGERTVIVTRDDDFIALSEAFAMHAMLSEKRTYHLDPLLKKNPFVTHVRNKKNSGGALPTKNIIDSFNKRVSALAKEALRAPQERTYIGLTSNGVFRGPSLQETFLRYMRAPSRTPREEWLAAVNTTSLDVHGIDLPTQINWKKLNKTRKQAGLPAVNPEMYM